MLLQIILEFEGHLRAVAGERDAALDQLEQLEGRSQEAERRLREAERKEVGRWEWWAWQWWAGKWGHMLAAC
jgi:hypothetical protein